MKSRFFPVKEMEALAPIGEIKAALFQITERSRREQRLWPGSLSGEDAITDAPPLSDESRLLGTKDHLQICLLGSCSRVVVVLWSFD